MIINPKRILLSLCFFACLLSSQAQENNCITFEEFEVEQNFGRASGDEPGSVAFTQGNVKVTLEPFQYFDGSTDFWNATVYETLFSDFELADGKSLFVSNINLKFDFTALEKPVRKICMAYFDGGGEENISVNGSPIFVLNHFGEAPQEIAPGVTLTIEPPVGNNQFLSTGMICLEGDIKTLLIGGQEFGLDNICWDTCPIYHVTAGITGCQQHPNLYYEYDIQLNFLHGGPSVAGFGLSQNGEFIGNYEYAQLPLTLPNVPNFQGLDTFVYTICTNDNQGCCREVKIPLAPCEDICQLEARVEEVGCNDAGTEYIAHVAVEGQNVSDTLRVSNSQGLSYFVVKDPGTQLIEIGFAPQENSVDLVTICDYDDPSCCYSLWIQYPCVPSDECQFNDFEATILECYETDAGIAYDVKINFEPSGMSNEFFDLHSREGFVDTYRFDQLPITLSGYVPEGNPDNLWFKVREENDNPDCQAVTEVATGECQATECAIENVTLWEIDCNATGTEYIALVSIEGQGLSNKFKATNALGEVFYGEYPPAGHEIELGFSTRESGTDRIEICDSQYEGCCFVLELEYPCQPNLECQFNDFEAVILECYETDAGIAYDVKINFEPSGMSNEFFDLHSREGFVDTYRFDQLPITLSGYVPEGNPDNLWFKVREENDNPDCQAVTEVATGECQASNCVIENITVWEMGCNANATEYLALISIAGQGLSNKFKATNSLGESFYYEYPEPGSEVQIGFSTQASGTDRIEICDSQYEGCCFVLEVQYPCQPNISCEINGLEAYILDCYETDAGTAYDVKINFQASGTNNEFFDLYGREGLIDFFPFEQLPITVNGYIPEGNPDNLWFKVTENDNPECQAVTEVATGDCTTSNCVIQNVTVWGIDCNASGTEYLALISIEGEGLSNKFKATNSTGESFFYEYPPSGSEVQIGFSTNENGTDVIEICDYEHPDCCKIIEVEYPCQPNGSCVVRDLEVSVLDCEVTGTGYAYDLKINFEAEGFSSEYVDLYLEGEWFDTFALDQRPITISNYLHNPNSDGLTVKVSESGNLDCHQVISVPLYPCDNSGECHISEVIAEAHNCDGNTYLLDIAFQSSNPGPLGYYVYGDGAIFGPYSYDEPFVTIGPFEGDGETIVDILILDIADPSCFGYLEYGPLDCETQCRINEVYAEQLDCVDGGFYVQIGFEAENMGPEGFTIRGNGQNYGSFSYDEVPLMVGPIEANSDQVLEFIIIDNSNPNCRAFTTLEPIDCPNCEIEGLNYTVDCQETGLNFTLELDFIANDPDSEHFYIKFDEEIYERFSYAALPIAIDLPLSLAEASKISVCDTENPDCCQTIDFNIPCCSVRDLVVEAHPCEEDGTFLVDLNLLHTNTSDSFTLVYGPTNGDLQSAQHTYGELFLTLGPLNGMNQEEWFFQVTDESLFCSTSEEFTFETCEPAECIGFEDADTGSFGPLTGYEEGAVFLEESDVAFRIASSCECFVHLVEYPSVFPAFTLAQGQMIVLDGSGVEIDLSNVSSAVEELNIDYYFDGNTITLQVNDQDPIVVDNPANLPSVVAAGVNLTVTQSESDPNMGTLTFTGNVDKIEINVEGKMSLDNLCITLGTEEVWPGDINTDNIANHFDLLPLGIAQGVEGPIRENETTDWQGIPAAPWSLSFPNGLNYKHADTDGNGFIDSLDKAAILENFLLTHGEVVPFEPIEATPNNPTLFVETPNEGWPSGQAFNLPIVLGSPALPVEGLHGIAFTIRFDPQSIDPTSIALDFSNSWLGDDGHDLLTLDRTAEEEGVIYVALSRVGPQELFGSGPVASLIGIIDDIAGRQATTLSVEAPLAVTATLDTIPIFTQSSDLIIQRFQEVPKLDLLKSLVLSPNPTNDEVRIWNKFGVPVDQVDVMDSAGNLLTTVKEGANRISLKSQPAGVYMLRIRMGGVIAHRRIIRL